MTNPAGKPDPQKYVLVGKVAKVHGIKGELKVFPYSGQAADFSGYREVLLVAPENGETASFSVTNIRGQGKYAIVKLAGIDDRESAERLGGSEVWTDKEFLPPLGVDEFYWHEMVGLRVQTDEGLALGKVRALFSTGAHDVLVIAGQGREYLIPAKHEFIVSMDSQAGLLVVSPPPGLLEMND